MGDATCAWIAPVIVFVAWTIASTQGPVAIMIAGPVAHAVWMALECRRRRRPDTAGWTFAAALSGPLAVAIYLAVEYRLRALLWIPLYVLAYITPVQLALYVHMRGFGGPF